MGMTASGWAVAKASSALDRAISMKIPARFDTT